MNIRVKITLLFLLASMVTLASGSLFFYYFTVSNLRYEIRNNLLTTAVNKAKWISSYLFERKQDVEILAQMDDIRVYFDELKAYHDAGGVTLMGSYDVTAEKYIKIYDEIDPFFKKFLVAYGYYDIFFMCTAHGHVMYTSGEKINLGVNLSVEPYKNNSLAKLLNKVLENKKPSFLDFEYYGDSNRPSLFIGATVLDEKGEIYAVVALRLNAKRINEIMQDSTGLGETGQTYLVGSDYLMRSDSKFSGKNTILGQRVDTENARLGFLHRTRVPITHRDVDIYKDYRGVSVLGTHVYLPEMDWVLLAEITTEEAFRPVARLKCIMAAGITLVLLFMGIIAVFIAKTISRPITALCKRAEMIGAGNLDHKSEMRSSDEIGQLAGAFDQMTEKLKNFQEKLIRSEKLAAVGKLGASVAHELRNPLGAIRNSIYFLKMKMKENPDSKIKKHLDMLGEEINISDKIINDILTFSSIKQLNVSEIRIDDVIKEALAKVYIPKNVELNMELKMNLPGIMADEEQLKHVFYNIILNAVQAMNTGGTLNITTVIENNIMEVIISDTGAGIQKDNLSKIFEPLFSTKIKGVGLGLTVCKSIIDLHNGSIDVQSEYGKGTRFILKLPVSSKEV